MTEEAEPVVSHYLSIPELRERVRTAVPVEG